MVLLKVLHPPVINLKSYFYIITIKQNKFNRFLDKDTRTIIFLLRRLKELLVRSSLRIIKNFFRQMLS